MPKQAPYSLLPCLLATGLLALSCVSVAPLYERARPVEDGYSVGGAAYVQSSLYAGDWASGYLGASPYLGRQTSGNCAVRFEYALGDWSAFGRTAIGAGYWTSADDGSWHRWVAPFELELGGKVPLGDRNAIRVGWGWPALLSAAWPMDINHDWSSMMGVGFNGITVASTRHFALGAGLVGHASVGIAGSPLAWPPLDEPEWIDCFAASAGFAVDWQPAPNAWPDFLGRPPGD